MAAITQLAAARINAARAGLTGPTALPSQEPGAPAPASAVEVSHLIPTEFGGLTHLFGGEAQPAAQYEPVNNATVVPGGSLRGTLGGLKPDFTNVLTKAGLPGAGAVLDSGVNYSGPPVSTTNVGGPPVQIVPLSVSVKNTVTRIRSLLKI